MCAVVCVCVASVRTSLCSVSSCVFASMWPSVSFSSLALIDAIVCCSSSCETGKQTWSKTLIQCVCVCVCVCVCACVCCSSSCKTPRNTCTRQENLPPQCVCTHFCVYTCWCVVCVSCNTSSKFSLLRVKPLTRACAFEFPKSCGCT